MESDNLFSLEIFVEKIENLTIECGIPAVAFRFLDYPTLLVYFAELDAIDHINKKLELKNVSREKVIADELNELRCKDYNGYEFRKGKSCLFRHTWKSLKRALAEVPLYITLVDCVHQASARKQPRIVGVGSLPLLSLVESVDDVSQHNDIPVTSRRASTLKLFNLMGTQIALLNVTVKLTCYGSSLLRHVTVERESDSHINIFLKNLSLQDDDRGGKCSERKGTDGLTRKNNNVESSPLREVLPADGVTNRETENMRTEKSSQTKRVRTNTKRIRRRHFKETFFTEEEEIRLDDMEDEHDNISRPPPLFLNLHPSQKHSIVEEKPFRDEQSTSRLRQRSRFLTETKFHEEFTEESGSSLTSDEDCCDPIIERLLPAQGSLYTGQDNDAHLEKNTTTSRKNEKNNRSSKKVNSRDEKDTVSISKLKDTMPVLCSLINEIARFNDILNPGQEQRSIGRKVNDVTDRENSGNELVQPSRCSKERLKPRPKSLIMNDEPTDENRGNNIVSAEPERRKCADHRNNNKPFNVKQRVSSNKKTNEKGRTKKNLKKLSYGLTKTQRLRYAMTHGGEGLPNGGTDVINTGEDTHGDSASVNRLQDLLLDDEDGEDRSQEEITGNDPQGDYDDQPIEETASQKLFDVGIQTSIENLAANNQVTTEDNEVTLPKRSESKVGFHSPVEPRHISPSELFDDNKPWSSASSTNQMTAFRNSANQMTPFESPANQRSSLRSNEGEGYSDESFASSGTISGTSSISLPQVSFTASSSPLKINDTMRNSSARSLKSDVRRSALSTTQRGNNDTKLSSPHADSFRESSLSFESPRRSTTHLSKISHGNKRDSVSAMTSSSSHRSVQKDTKKDDIHDGQTAQSDASSSVKIAKHSQHRQQQNSIHSSVSDLRSSASSLDRGSPDFPKQSSHSPIKSKYQKRGDNNVLNVTIPTAALLGTTSSFPDSTL